MKKMKSRSFRILMAAVISAAMLCPQVKISAADGLVSKAVTSYFRVNSNEENSKKNRAGRMESKRN